ncbi:type I-F CRISPR-associated protein Csy1 [Testudinibacter sp. P27/CKL/0425]
MEQITSEQIKSAVQAFLTAQYEKKTEAERKQLAKAKETNDLAKVSELEASLAGTRKKYQLDNWIVEAERMAKQLKFGTHISKGIHPDAKGDNINFQTDRTLPIGLVGSQSIDSLLLDANGNAAALPLAAFFDINIGESPTKLRALIMQDSPLLDGVFAENKTLSAHYQRQFKAALSSELQEPTTHERNKQLLFSLGTGNYRCIIPLYPSVLTHEFYQRIIGLRFSEENKTARENRFKKTAEQKPYLSILNTATTQLGGTKPQNVSQLMSKQGGRNYLLPSLPPHFQRQRGLRIGARTESIFAKNLAYICREPLEALFKLIERDYKSFRIRNARESILDDILFRILQQAMAIQSSKAPGWTTALELNYHEKLWLDPQRAELADQEQFKIDRNEGRWREKVAERFANWLNYELKQHFKTIKDDFADPEHSEWRGVMNDVIKDSLLSGKEVFQ